MRGRSRIGAGSGTRNVGGCSSMSDKPEDVFGSAINIFDPKVPPKGITSVATSFSPPGPLQPDIIFEDELRMIWRSYGFTNAQINEMLREGQDRRLGKQPDSHRRWPLRPKQKLARSSPRLMLPRQPRPPEVRRFLRRLKRRRQDNYDHMRLMMLFDGCPCSRCRATRSKSTQDPDPKTKEDEDDL